jgi:tetratricopeptide (TPR) repeat protein
MEPVGVVKSKQNSNSTRDQSEFLLYKDTSIIYSTPDGTQPTFYPSQTESSVGSILVIILACAIPFFTVLMASLALCRTPGTKLARRKLQMNRLERVLLQNESFYIVARDVSVGRTFNCHRSTWVAETHLVDVALLVLKDNRNIEKTADSEDIQLHARAQAVLGRYYAKVGDSEVALHHYSSALDTMGDAGDLISLVEITTLLGEVLQDAGRTEEAMEHYRESLVLAEANDLRMQIGELLSRLGGVAPDKQRRMEYLQRALSVFRELGAKSRMREVQAQVHRAVMSR